MPMSPEETEQLLVKVINYYRGGTLHIEDLNRIYGDALPQSVTGLLCNVRHRNCDVTFNLQSVGRILPKMRQNTKIIEYHYQLDSIADSEDKLKGEAEIYFIAEKLVNKQFSLGNKRFFVYIYREIKKIKGAFSPRMFTEAIQEYLSENEKVFKPLLNKRDASGKKIYNYQQALNAKTIELYHKYWGNIKLEEDAERNPFLMITTGTQGIGKSYTRLKQCIYQAYFAKHKRSSLLFDTNGEYSHYEIDGKVHNIKLINIW